MHIEDTHIRRLRAASWRAAAVVVAACGLLAITEHAARAAVPASKVALRGQELSNSGLCLPNGTPRNMDPVAHEYLFSPGRVTILLEDSEIRRIWTDGRPHVPDDQVNPSFSGDSIGHWEGDTLVVDTTNIYPEAELFIGMRVTEQTHVSERINRVGNRMRIDTVVEDPELFTKPWVYSRWYDHEEGPPIDYERCTEADRAKKGDAVKSGDKVKVTYRPVRDGRPAGYMVAVMTAEGRYIGRVPDGQNGQSATQQPAR